jgi:hypothetical protein
MMLERAGFDLSQVRLLRHTKKSGFGGMSPLRAWREHRDRFEAYQSTQPCAEASFFGAPYWASFVSMPDGGTMFVGVYAAELETERLSAFECPLTGVLIPAEHADRYATTLLPSFADYAGRLFVDWGAGTRRWFQYADRQVKPVVELRRDEADPPYPGHSQFLRQLSEIEALPTSWKAILASSRGVYLLTCPRTKEQYVGAALAGGFLARWTQHALMSGDAIAFRSRDPEDYRVSILEVAGSLTTDDDILRMEQRWKEKLQSREMGLNRN